MLNLHRLWDKNNQEIAAVLSGRLSLDLRAKRKIPVFVFHSVEPVLFEKQMSYLDRNGYQTLDADGLFAVLQNKSNVNERTVALTFDDASGSFWAVAYPLLKRYGFKAILFVIPGLVPLECRHYPNLEEFWDDQEVLKNVLQRERIQPLCTWRELSIMNDSGVVDIQSHSFTHSRIFVSTTLTDFINPNFDPWFFKNVNIPISRTDSVEKPLRQFRLGMPIYKFASRLSGQTRYLEDTAVSEELIQYVKSKGNKKFFTSPGWWAELFKNCQKLLKSESKNARFETNEERREAIRLEVYKSKIKLEEMFPNKKIEHFCYPWFQGSELGDSIARDCGYKSVYYGYNTMDKNNVNSRKIPISITRISEEYLHCLPGKGRTSLFSVWMKKFRNYLNR